LVPLTDYRETSRLPLGTRFYGPPIHFEASTVNASDSEPAIKIVRTLPRIEELATNNFSLALATSGGAARTRITFS
jgi:hypothetical protein